MAGEGTPFLNLDKISENSKIYIGLPKNQTIVSFLSQNVLFGGSAEYGEFDDQILSAYGSGNSERKKAIDGILGAIQAAGQVGSSALRASQQWLGSGIPEMKLKTINSTVVTWQNSPRFQMSVEMTFLAYKPGMDVKAPVRALVQSTYPTWQSSAVLYAPNDYDATNRNCVSLKIGKWLKIPKYLLITAANFYFSKETLEDGNPLYASGTVNFTAYRHIDARTIGQFLKDPGNEKSGLADNTDQA